MDFKVSRHAERAFMVAEAPLAGSPPAAVHMPLVPALGRLPLRPSFASAQLPHTGRSGRQPTKKECESFPFKSGRRI